MPRPAGKEKNNRSLFPLNKKLYNTPAARRKHFKSP
jgi:hypothetical protein